MIEQLKKIWMDGKLVDWDQACVHVLTHTLHYGMGVFEGIRCYRCASGRSAVFRLEDHLDRLLSSAHIATITIPFSKEELEEAVLLTLKANDLEEGYIRPIAFIAESPMGVYPKDYKVRVAVAVWPWGAYLGEEGVRNGIRAKISSFTRHHVNVSMTKAKICGNYANSFLAKKEAVDAGYDEAILLDTEGYVCEASGENIFIVRNRVLKTPPLTSILPGVTRDAVLHIATDMDVRVVEERFTRDELYSADEAFLTGTAAEITPIREVDGRKMGKDPPGEITRSLMKRFFDIVRGKDERYLSWLTFL